MVVVVGVVVVVVAVAVLDRSLVGCLICSWPALPLAVMCEFSGARPPCNRATATNTAKTLPPPPPQSVHKKISNNKIINNKAK